MIKNKDDFNFYLHADRLALRVGPLSPLSQLIEDLVKPNVVWRFQRSLRRCEYLKNSAGSPVTRLLFLFSYRKFRILSQGLGFSIPLNTCGPGLSIAHYGTIVINPAAKLGKNCRIHVCVNIGASGGEAEAPQIGDDVYIGPGAKLFGDISIADGVVIGANAVVNKSVAESRVSIGGVPAKVLGDAPTSKVIIPAAELAKKGIQSVGNESCEMLHSRVSS